MNKAHLDKPVGDMTLEALQEHLRPAIREMVIEAVIDARHREEGFMARYDKPTEVLISTMSVKIDEMGEDIVEIKQRLGKLEDRAEEHRRENDHEFGALRQAMEEHRQENEQEFKAIRQEMNAGFTALRQVFDEHRQENEQEFKAIHQVFDEHRQENEQEFKAIRQEMNAGFTALRQVFDEHRQENEREFRAIRQEIHQEILEVHKVLSRQLKWMVGTMVTVGGLIVAVVAFFR